MCLGSQELSIKWQSTDEAALLPTERRKCLFYQQLLPEHLPPLHEAVSELWDKGQALYQHTHIHSHSCSHFLEYSHKITNKQLMATVQKQYWHYDFVPLLSTRLQRLERMGFSPQIECESKTWIFWLTFFIINIPRRTWTTCQSFML